MFDRKAYEQQVCQLEFLCKIACPTAFIEQTRLNGRIWMYFVYANSDPKKSIRSTYHGVGKHRLAAWQSFYNNKILNKYET